MSESTQQYWQRVAMDYLARREYSAQELRQRLHQKGADEQHIVAVLNYLQAKQLQSDRRFSENYIRYRAQKGFGPRRISQELSQRGVNEALITEMLAASDIDWQQLARAVLLKKFKQLEAADYHEKAKQLKFLQYRGFAAQLPDD